METKTFAESLLAWIKEGLHFVGLPASLLDKMDTLIYLVVILLIAWLAGRIIHFVVQFTLNRILKRRKIILLSKLIEYDTLHKLSAIIPPIITLALLPFAFEKSAHLLDFLERCVWIYFIIVMSLSLCAILSSVGSAAFMHEKRHDRPVKGFIQILQIGVWCIACIIIISILIHKSPMFLITGLGAFAAILILVFKDSLLDFVGGILLLQNDMVRLGDWIEIPDSGINGNVIDISLTIVKVRNFDNTIATVPPYTLISGTFINWRGMKESGGRRIMQEVNLMYDYIKPSTPEFLERMKHFDSELGEFIIREQKKKSMPGEETATREVPEGDIATNAGLLRAYMMIYLRRHPFIEKRMLTMVRLLEPTPYGLPMQIYCFTNDTDWVHFENIQAQVMEHFIAVMPLFELFASQNTTSRDYIIGSYLRRGMPIDMVDIMPWRTVKKDAEMK